MKYILTTIILASLFVVRAQNVDFKASNFKDDKEGLKKAQEAIKKGDELFELANEAIFLVKSPGLNYELALQEFMKAQDFNPKNGELNFKIGVCHANSPYSEKGISFLYEAHNLMYKVFQQTYFNISMHNENMYLKFPSGVN